MGGYYGAIIHRCSTVGLLELFSRTKTRLFMCNLVLYPPCSDKPLFHPPTPASTCHPGALKNKPNGHLSQDWTQCSRTPTARKPEPTCLKQPPLHTGAIEIIQAATSVHHPASPLLPPSLPPSSVPLNYVMSQMSSHTADCSVQPLDITGDNASNRASVLGG